MSQRMKYLVNSVFVVLSLLLIFLGTVRELAAQNKTEVKNKLFVLADAVLHDASYDFIDRKTNRVYTNLEDVPENVLAAPRSTYNDWRYWNGVMNLAMLRLSQVTGEKKYKEFAVKNIEFDFDTYSYYEKKHAGENKWSYPFGEFFIMEELDDCGAMGASVIAVNNIDPQQRYLDYINKAANHIMTDQTRLDDKTFVRAFPHKWTLWADDLYMALSFLTRMYDYTKDEQYLNDAVLQVINFHKYLFDDKKELMYHNWYSDLNEKGVALWGRANGWAIVAQADLLDRLPIENSQREQLIKLFKKHILGIAKYQSGNGLWHQLLDKEDSYLETSCSAMFTYAVARGVNMGYLDKRYASIALQGWKGIESKIHEDGSVEGVCTGTVVSDNLVDYYNRPAPLNDVHGIGTVIMAGAEVTELIKNLNE